MQSENLVIIGSGPAAYTAAIYAARAEIAPFVFEGFMSGMIGGQLMTTTDVENFPGFPEGILGSQLMDNMKRQAARFGARFVQEDVIGLDISFPFIVKGSKTQVSANAIIIATGASAKRLDVPGTRDGEFWQKGVTACAVCDGAAPIFRNKELYIIGGGDTAAEEALFLTKYAKKVYMVVRSDKLRASKIMAERVLNHPKIEVLWNMVLNEVKGDEVVREVVLKDRGGKTLAYPAGGVFFAIGHKPNTDFLKGLVDMDEYGYLSVTNGSFASKEGIFAAGDVQDRKYRQAITAAGSGCMAALDAARWLFERELIK